MMIGKESVPEWLNIEWALSQFGTRILVAQKRFIKFIKDGVEEGQLWDSLRHQIYLGEKAFIESVHLKSEMDRNLSEVPRIQARNIGRPIDYYQTETRCRNDAIIEAYKSGDFTQKQLSEYFGLHYSSISKI